MSDTMIGWVLLAMLVLVVVLFILAGGIALGARDHAARRRGAVRDFDRSADVAHFPWFLWWSDSSMFARSSNEAVTPRLAGSEDYSSERAGDYSSGRDGGRTTDHTSDQPPPGALAPDPFSLSSGFGTHETAGGAAGFDNGFDAGGGTGGSFDSGVGGFDAGACDSGSS